MRIQWSPASTVCTTTHSAYASTASTRTGAPPATADGIHRSPANFRSERPAQTRAACCPPSASTFTTNAPDVSRASRVCDCLSTQTSSRGGRADTADTALQVSPRGLPSASTAVTIETIVGNEPNSS